MELETGEAPAHEAPSMRRVARNTAYMLAGEAGVKLFGFAFTVFVVRRLGADDFGRYSAALAFVAVFAALTDLGTSQLSIREMARSPQRAGAWIADLMALRVVLSLVTLGVLPALAQALGEDAEMVAGIFVASLTLVVYAALGPVQSYLVARERLEITSLGSVLNQALFIVLGSVALLLHTGFMGLLVATLLAQLAVGATVLSIARRHLGLSFERPVPGRIPAIVRRGFPFFISQVSDTSLRRFDLVWILFALSAVHVGWYSVSFNLVMMLLPLVQSLGLALFPSLARQHDAAAGSIDRSVQRAVRYVVLASLPIAVGTSLLAERLITVLYTPAFEPAVPVLRILVWALPSLFLSEILGYTALSLHLERGMARLSLVATAVGVLLLIGGVALWGICGAATAAVITRLFVAVASLFLVGPQRALRGNLGALLRIAASAAFMGGGVALVLQFPEALPASGAGALAILITVGFVLYVAAVLVSRAVDVTERRFLVDVASQAFRRIAARA
jgi:O-antigen/teichoic acid export membrane protein